MSRKAIAMLPPRAREVLRWVLAYQRRAGYMPSLRELATGLGMRSHNGPKYYLNMLESRGYLVRTFNTARAYQLTPAGQRIGAAR